MPTISAVAPSKTTPSTTTPTTPPATSQSTSKAVGKAVAISINDPKSVTKALKQFKPVGNNRNKVVTLQDEAIHLNLNKNPIAFCFLLRSMFEISAKAYCRDHASSGLKAIKTDGSDRSLVDVLRDVVNHITKNNTDKEKVRMMHGAMTELAKPDGLLSITSLNQLVHNPNFSTTAHNISVLFGNIFPLLDEMNR